MISRRLKSTAFMIFFTTIFADSMALAAPPKLPNWKQVEQIVDQQLTIPSNYQPGDLISCKQVDPIFDMLQRAGWKVSDREAILKLVPRENEFFVRELRSPQGRGFMRQINKFPLGYDRVDRLCRIPMGEPTVQALIAGPDGYKMIQYMTESSYGRNLGKMISQDPHGANFNAPTGRIYTVEALLKRLRASYDAELLNQ